MTVTPGGACGPGSQKSPPQAEAGRGASESATANEAAAMIPMSREGRRPTQKPLAIARIRIMRKGHCNGRAAGVNDSARVHSRVAVRGVEPDAVLGRQTVRAARPARVVARPRVRSADVLVIPPDVEE